MKKIRHRKIVEIIENHNVETQEELAGYLKTILVVKTVSGMAMAVAAALDALKFPEIVGCIAGDDTIMVAVRTVEDTQALMDKIHVMIEK